VTCAGVNLKNGNFYITYSDLSIEKNGHALEITRTYNSKATGVGWFGFGWGSKYETQLVVLPDGSAVVKEAGNGRDVYYRTSNDTAIRAGVKRIVEAATQKNNLSPVATQELSVKLLADEELRVSESITYAIKSELQNDGALEDDCGKGNLVSVPEGYRRRDCNRFGDSQSATDTFDKKGRIIRHELKNGYAVMVNYTNDGTAEIRDTLGQRIAMTWNPDGRVVRVASGDQSTTYTYENKNLVTVKLDHRGPMTYSYDDQHNLTRIRYGDSSNMFISYSPQVSGQADAVTERTGSQQTFQYRTDPNNANRYWTTRTEFSSSGVELATRVFEFENQTGQTGITQPSRIVQGGANGSTETQYDEKGRITRKADSDGGLSEYIYRGDKLILILKKDLRTEFHYDPKGNLIQAANSTGKVVDLSYAQSSDLIQGIVVSKHAAEPRRKLKFNYNANGRPTEITLIGIGKIQVEYDAQGDISKVESKQGAKMVRQVTQAFQDVLTVVSVAGAKF
jgi:YD repeat-containing protein